MPDEAIRGKEGPTAPTPTVEPKLVSRMLQRHWEKDKAAEGAKVNPDALRMTGELLRTFVVEAHKRAQFEADLDGDNVIVPQHIERVMLGLMLDF